MANYAGTTGADIYAGTAQDDTIHDGDGGSDSLSGDAGSDVITVTGGYDTIDGGSGDDRLVMAWGPTVGGISTSAFSGDLANGYTGFYDGAGSNNLSFSGIEHFTLLYDTATLGIGMTTGDGNDSLVTGSGADALRTGGGRDAIDAGAGIDSWGADLSAETGDVIVDLTQATSIFLGTASITNVEGFNSLTTGSGDDQITGTNVILNETINSGGGNDVVTMLGMGTDTVDGGVGRDRLVAHFPAGQSSGVSTNFINGDFASGYTGLFDGAGSHNLAFSGIEDFTVSIVGAGPLTITTGDGNDVLTGADGADVLNSGGGIDVIDGGAGIDSWGADMSAATDDIVIDLNAASSSFLGTGSVTNVEGFTTLSTGSGDDEVTGTAAFRSETVNTGAGDDVITLSGEGTDSVDGGLNRDRLALTYTTAVTLGALGGDFANGYSGLFDGVGSENLAFVGIEDFSVTMLGANILIIQTGDGDDVLAGGDGADLLNSGGGIDVIDGGGGIDRWGADMSLATDDIVIDLNAASSTFLGTGSVTNVEGFTALSTGSGEDRITGTTAVASETIDAGAGDDVVTMSGSGTDSVIGGDGSDRLVFNSPYDIAMTASGSLAAGYSGVFDGPGSTNLFFSGVEHFTVTFAGPEAIEITTGDGDDVLLGGDGGDDFIAAGGADRLDGRGGSDSLQGGDGADTITAGLGVDTVVGGLGLDRLVIDYAAATAAISSGAYAPTAGGGFSGSLANPTDGADVVFSGIEDFHIFSGSGADTLVGADGADLLSSGAGVDSLTGGAGDDTLDGGHGNDTLVGGLDVDTASFASLGFRVTASLSGGTAVAAGGGGTDQLSGIENLIGTAFNDSLTGDGGANHIQGGDGADTIDGGAGNDTLTGAGGSDTASYASAGAGVTVALVAGVQNTGGAGSDLLAAFEHLSGSGFADALTGDDGANSVLGGAGEDTLVGGLGGDTLDGGAGTADTADYSAAAGGVVVSLQAGTATGGAGSDTVLRIERIVGSNFGDRLTGSSSHDELLGGDGKDTLVGGGGNDTLDGGQGRNTVSYGAAAAGVTVSLAASGAQNTGGAGIDTLANFADLTGSNSDDVLTGDGSANRLLGLGGDDSLAGGGGADSLDGGDRNDTLAGGAGDDQLNGGGGKNTVTYADAAAGVTVSLAITGAQNTGGDGTDVVLRMRNLIGSSGHDSLTGDDRANSLVGGVGSDTIDGGDGKDRLDGGLNNDRLAGGLGRDRINGGDGNDRINGGARYDLLTGGAGNDTFVFDRVDLVSDRIFDLASGDTVDVSAIDANSTTGGNQAFVLVSGFHHEAGEARLNYKAGKDETLLELDIDGDGTADMTVTLDGDQRGFTGLVL